MLIKRIISLILGFAFTLGIAIFTNEFIVSIVISILMIISINEFGKAFNNKKIYPINIISYFMVIIMFTLNSLSYFNVISLDTAQIYSSWCLPLVTILIVIMYILLHHKYSIIDVGITLIELIYCVLMFSNIINVYALENGKILLWYIFIGSWFTDIFAFCIGKMFGKHKFTSISPNKSIEGCIAGILGCVISLIIYTYIINLNFNLNINYIVILVFSIICSIVSQCGDLFASSIKRYVEIKDFGNVFPGHGGVLDRFDSTIFVAPIVYLLFIII